MAEKKKKTTKAEPGALEGVKKTLSQTATLAQLKYQHGRTAAARKDAYARLGELSYALYRPRTDSVPADINAAIQATVAEITSLSAELTELALRIEILKANLKNK